MATADANVPYYAARAREYDASSSYQRPESRAALAPMRAQYQLAFAGADVLEVACGTGYWTRTVALTARSLTATDVNEEVLAVARARASFANVRFQRTDAFTLDGIEGPFTGAFAQFWWSHIPVAKVRSFLTTLHSQLAPGALVMFADTLQTRVGAQLGVDSDGDLVIRRKLRNGTPHEIIKNLPTEAELRGALADFADDLVYKRHEFLGWWIVSYRARG